MPGPVAGAEVDVVQGDALVGRVDQPEGRDLDGAELLDRLGGVGVAGDVDRPGRGRPRWWWSGGGGVGGGARIGVIAAPAQVAAGHRGPVRAGRAAGGARPPAASSPRRGRPGARWREVPRSLIPKRIAHRPRRPDVGRRRWPATPGDETAARAPAGRRLARACGPPPSAPWPGWGRPPTPTWPPPWPTRRPRCAGGRARWRWRHAAVDLRPAPGRRRPHGGRGGRLGPRRTGPAEAGPVAGRRTWWSVAGGHDDPLCREAAVAALGAIGDVRGLPAILAATSDKPAVRRRAVIALAPFDGPEVDAALARARARPRLAGPPGGRGSRRDRGRPDRTAERRPRLAEEAREPGPRRWVRPRRRG